jgi:hypothetical protein
MAASDMRRFHGKRADMMTAAPTLKPDSRKWVGAQESDPKPDTDNLEPVKNFAACGFPIGASGVCP